MLLSILCLLDPHPDSCVREYFSHSSNRTAFALRDRLFFLHLFDLTLKKLNSIEFESKTAAELPELWREWLKSNRSDFYGYVAQTVCFSALRLLVSENNAQAEEDFKEHAKERTYGA